jgi:RNA-directed DNA polymerase
VLANIYLYFVLDLWFEKIVKPRCKGAAIIMRFADDFVCCFQYLEDMKKFQNVIMKRLGKFNLELSLEKTKVLKFNRFEAKKSKSFVFLGFEFRWILSRKKKPLVSMKTAKKKFQLALASMQSWIRAHVVWKELRS